MAEKTQARDSILTGVRVIDGGLASELEYLGARVDGSLWSAQVLESEPEKIAAVHRAYIEAGSQCIATCSYQVSRQGYAEVGLAPDCADAALLRSVALARSVTGEFPLRRILVAASLGPYGAVLHNGAEYHGNYDLSYVDLVAFHRERIAVLAAVPAQQAPDLLAFETIPSLEEARAIGEALAPWPQIPVWFSFSCKDQTHVSHGEPVAASAAAAALPQTVAIGVNCVPPHWVPSLIAELQSASSKPVMVYPNSGEGWDSSARCWTGNTAPAEFGELASDWYSAGAQIVGGCCRIRPAHILQVALAAQNLSS